jgi:hypothetical protein
MLRNYQFWILTVIGAFALVLAGANMYFAQTNSAMQTAASGRAQYIQRSIDIESLYREVVQALADRAVKTHDDQIRDLLAAEGFNVNFNAPPPAPPAPGKPR